jgi:hypothetical protein
MVPFRTHQPPWPPRRKEEPTVQHQHQRPTVQHPFSPFKPEFLFPPNNTKFLPLQNFSIFFFSNHRRQETKRVPLPSQQYKISPFSSSVITEGRKPRGFGWATTWGNPLSLSLSQILLSFPIGVQISVFVDNDELVSFLWMSIRRFKSKLWRIVEISEVLGKYVFRRFRAREWRKKTTQVSYQNGASNLSRIFAF